MICYNEVRPRIRSGDLIETASDDGLSFCIRTVTGRRVSHSAMVLRIPGWNLDDDLFVMEAWCPGGLRTRRLSVLVADSDEVIWYPCVAQAEETIKAVGWMLAHVGVGYDFIGAARAGFGMADPDDSDLFCSEAIAMAFRHAGTIPVLKKAPVPGDFGQFKIFAPKGIVLKQS